MAILNITNFLNCLWRMDSFQKIFYDLQNIFFSSDYDDLQFSGLIFTALTDGWSWILEREVLVTQQHNMGRPQRHSYGSVRLLFYSFSESMNVVHTFI